MTNITINSSKKIQFVLVDSSGVEVTGLGTTFTVQVSKNGGAFAAGTGTKTEIGSGWYTYTIPAAETNTNGPLALVVTGSGADQLNLSYEVVGYDAAVPASTYTTLTDVKNYLGIPLATTTDDALITLLIARAQDWIDQYTGRTFAAAADTTRYYRVGTDTEGTVLYLDTDLAQITSVYTNLDNGTGGELVTTTDYTYIPRNSLPTRAIDLKPYSTQQWKYTHDPVDAVSVTGRFAYSVTPPNAIIQACTRLTAYLYKQKDAQVFDVTASAETGMLTLPQGMPKDVAQILSVFIRPGL